MTKLVAGTVAVAVSVDTVDGEQHRRHAVQKRGGGRLSILGYVEEGGGFGRGSGHGCGVCLVDVRKTKNKDMRQRECVVAA